MRRILRYEVPVDDQWHKVELTGRILHVACRKPGIVEFWAFSGEEGPFTVQFTVVGTGHEIKDDETRYVGTTFDAHTKNLVWHLLGKGWSA